ncbi:MAG: hypothetical protein B6D58_07385 [candidate division Zixibacteria bacterium 4484_95]|nr:MAG: hypothetical protein B6D58_07385 [candidate division Zixibacteria bacterium 4484_95]
MKPLQAFISGFLGLWGIYLMMHFWGNLTLKGIISIVIGMMLIGVGIIGLTIFLRERLKSGIKS